MWSPTRHDPGRSHVKIFEPRDSKLHLVDPIRLDLENNYDGGPRSRVMVDSHLIKKKGFEPTPSKARALSISKICI